MTYLSGHLSVGFMQPGPGPGCMKIIGSNEALTSSIKNSFQKIMELLFKLGVWKASINSRKVPSTHMI